MGNQASSGRLSIVLDPPQTQNSSVYLAGRTLSGSVYAQATNNIQAVRVEAYISGKERTRVRYTETETYTDGNGNSRTRHHTRYRNAERSIYRVGINLGQVENIQAGAQYRFPFQVELPVDLPSSMYVARNGGYCKIDYKLKAHVGGQSKVEHVFNIMSSPLSMAPVPNLVPPIVKDVQSCCCFNMGHVTMGARVANTRIGRGETAIIDFACKNQSRQMIKSVTVEVKQELRWSAGHRSEHSNQIVAARPFNRTERWGELSKEELKSKKQSMKNDTDSHRDNKQQTLQMIHKAVNSGENRVLLNVPASALQTYHGSLIQVNHKMKITINFDGMFVDNPKITIPVYLGTPTSYGAEIVSSPQPSIPVATAMPTPSAPPPHQETNLDYAAPSAPPAEWAAAFPSAPVIVGQSAAIVGGSATDFDGEEGTTKPSQIIPVAEVVPSLSNLIDEIKLAVSPSDTVRKRLSDKKWAPIFNIMTPNQYSSVIKAVAIEFDQPDVAALIATSVREGNFTHEYVIAAIRVVSEWLRTPTLSKLLPLCKDLHENVRRIKAELTDWEKVCTERDFEQALVIHGQESLA